MAVHVSPRLDSWPGGVAADGRRVWTSVTELSAPRKVARARYTSSDTAWFLATLARLLPRDRWPIFLGTPSTLPWHGVVLTHCAERRNHVGWACLLR
jgi:hypothetical protein